MKKLLLLLSLGFTQVFSQTTNSISQYSVTFTFSGQHQYGTFANGDYWVVGPVTITSITPNYVNGYNGWEINPADFNTQGFDKRIPGFDSTKIHSLPYTAQPGESVIKSISDGTPTPSSQHWYLKTAVVLTVVATVPPNSGNTSFRPPYFSTSKPLYSTTSIDTNAIPTLPPVGNMPTLTSVKNKYQRLQMDHYNGWTGRMLHPADNLPDYGSSIATRNAEGALRLMMNESATEKMPALINYIQYGIDLYHIAAAGGSWRPSGGHMVGRKLPIAFAGWLLNNTAMKDTVKYAGIKKFDENGGVYYSTSANRVLYGQQGINQGNAEYAYWFNQVTTKGSRTMPDPYGYIDGGETPGGSYQYCCLSQPWKGNVLPAFMVCDIKEIWNESLLMEYVDRWVTFGTWAQADPCAPADTTMATYGIKFGPDGNGGCILDTDSSDGIGRFPNLHATNKNSGHYGSTFVGNVWNAYREYGNPIILNPSANDTICAGGISILRLQGIDTSKCHISWNNGAYTTDTFYVASPGSTSNITATVKYKNGLGCATTHSFIITVKTCTGIHTLNKVNIHIMPNPSAGEVTLSGLQTFGNNTTLKIYNMLGELLHAETLSNSAGTHTFNFSSHAISPGVYTVHIQDEKKHALEKIIYTEK